MHNKKVFRFAALCGFCLLMFLSGAKAQEKTSPTYLLTNGQFEMRATYKFSDQDTPVVDFGGVVNVTVKENEISIVVPVFNQPILMKLSGNTFRGKLKSLGANIEFQGEIVENNHTEGVFFGSFGNRKVTGLWTIKPAKKQSEQKKAT